MKKIEVYKKLRDGLLDKTKEYVKSFLTDNKEDIYINCQKLLESVEILLKDLSKVVKVDYRRYDYLKKKNNDEQTKLERSNEPFEVRLQKAGAINNRDNDIFKVREELLNKVNKSLMNIVFIRIILITLIQQLNTYFDISTTNKHKKSIMDKIYKLYEINISRISKEQYKLMTSKRFKGSFYRLIGTITSMTKKYVPSFKFDDFMKEYYPMSFKERSRIVAEYAVNNYHIVYNTFKQYTGKYGGLWIPAVVKVPFVRTTMLSKAKGVGADKNGSSKLVLYNLLTGDIIPCLNRTNTQTLQGDPCLNMNKIDDKQKKIQETLQKINFDGTIIIGPNGGNYKYMNLFVDKLMMKKKANRIYLNEYLSLSEVQQKNWVISNLDIFLKYFVHEKMFISKIGTSDYKMPVSVPYGSGVETEFMKKTLFQVKDSISTWDTSSKLEVGKDMESMKSAILSWATSGDESIISSLKSGLYLSYKNSLRSGFRGITAIVAKNILYELYNLKINKHQFTVDDINKITSHIVLEQQGGKRLHKEIRQKEKDMKDFNNKLITNIKSKNEILDFKKYYIHLTKRMNKIKI